ncbi:helix-turn-helix domain-containing protein [Arenibacterium sp. LLYu02]|uniref:helix-turn-helix domain-containing protein n=1 Tax=Arenibacterium sp. LLYu02 TaxID=3404132 RepID=UPI003B21ADA9
MSEHTYWEHLGLAAAMAVSAFVLLGLLLRLRERQKTKMHIWAMIAFFVVNIFDLLDTFIYSEVFHVSNAFFLWSDVLIPGFMVTLYFYVRALTSSTPKLRKKDAIHLLPFGVSFLFLLPELALPGDVRAGVVDGHLSEGYQSLIDLSDTVFWCGWIVMLIVYGGLSIRRLILHKRNIRTVFSALEGKTLRWLDGLVATILGLALIVVVDEVRLLMGYASIREGVGSLLFDVILPVAFGLFALKADPPLPDWTGAVLADRADLSPVDTPEEPAERYARSGLTPQDHERIANRLERSMSSGQLWRDHSLNLRRLASEVGVPPIHLSEVLNSKLGMSFYDYVNQCRIRDACDLLLQSNDTIIEISETVGFNAKSTFNTSFKKITDLTPSQWRVQHRSKPES